MRPNQILLNFEKQKKPKTFFTYTQRFNSSTINQQRSVVKQSHRVSPNEKGAMRCKKKRPFVSFQEFAFNHQYLSQGRHVFMN